MRIKVNLSGNTQATTDLAEPVVLPEKELVIAFESNVYKLYTLLVSVRNDTQGKQYKIKAPFELDLVEFLTPGVVEMEISILSKGEIVKTWRVPNITIKEHKATYEITPEIAELRKDISDTKTAIKELYTLLENQNII